MAFYDEQRPVDLDTYQDRQTLERTRLAGLNAPETGTPEAARIAPHVQALMAANAAGLGQRQGRDVVGRTVNTIVGTEGQDLNAEMVRRGYAQAVDYTGGGRKYGAEQFQRYNDLDIGNQKEREMALAGQGGDSYTQQQIKPRPEPERGWLDRTAKQLGDSTNRGFATARAGYFGTVSALGNLIARDPDGAGPKTDTLGEEWVKDPKTGKRIPNPNLSYRDRFSNWMQRTGERGYMRNMQQAEQNPKTMTFQQATESGKLADYSSFAFEAMGEAIPSFIEMLGVGAATAVTAGGAGLAVGASTLARAAGSRALARQLITSTRKKLIAQGMTPLQAQALSKGVITNLPKHLAQVSARRGFTAGMFGSSAGMQTGQFYKEAENETGVRAPGTALLAGAAAGALDVVGFEVFLSQLLNKRIPINKALDILKPVMAGVAMGVPSEGLTEAAQEVIGVLNTEYHRKSDIPLQERMMTKENLWRYAEAGAAGAVFGGVFGGAGGVARGTYDFATREKPPVEAPPANEPTVETGTPAETGAPAETGTPAATGTPLDLSAGEGLSDQQLNELIPDAPAEIESAPDYESGANPEGLPDFDSTANPEGFPDFDSTASPEGLPDLTPPATPEGFPDFDSTASPEGLPDLTPPATPEGLPDLTPPATPEGLPDLTPPATPEGLPDLTPPATPEGLPDFDASAGQNPRQNLDVDPEPPPGQDVNLNPDSTPPTPPAAKPYTLNDQATPDQQRGFLFDSEEAAAQTARDLLGPLDIPVTPRQQHEVSIAEDDSVIPGSGAFGLATPGKRNDELTVGASEGVAQDVETVPARFLADMDQARTTLGGTPQLRAALTRASPNGWAKDEVVPKVLDTFETLSLAQFYADEQRLKSGEYLIGRKDDGYAVVDLRKYLKTQPAPAPTPSAQPEAAKPSLPQTGNPHREKDQGKWEKANKFIGRGSKNSSTQKYANALGPLANSGQYEASDRVFVSAEGARTDRIEFDAAELQKALDAGAMIITDDATNRARDYNRGERAVATYLEAHGYQETKPGNGEWIPTTTKKPVTPKNQGVSASPEAAKPAAPITPTAAPSAAPSHDAGLSPFDSKRSAPTPGTTPEAFRQELSAKERKRLNAPNVHVLARTTDAPFPVAPDTAGLYLPDGSVYFFTENIAPGEAFGKTVHELGAHYGLQRMVGKEVYDSVLAELQRMVNAEGFASVKAAHQRAKEAGASDEALWHETLAYLAEASPRHGLIRRLVHAIKRFLRSLGVPVGKLTETDLVSLVQVAAFNEGLKGEGLSGEMLASTNLKPLYEAVSRVWRQIARHDDNFQFGRSAAKEIGTLATAMSRGAVSGQVIQHAEAGKIIRLRHQKGGVFDIANIDSQNPMFDAENASPNGAELYQIALAWVHNNNLTLADPGYLTPINEARQTSAFLSSALRFNTTDHLTPTASQGLTGWRVGDTEHNIALMALKELEWMDKIHSPLKDIYFDAPQDRFVYRGVPRDLAITDGTVQKTVRIESGSTLDADGIGAFVAAARREGRGAELGLGATTLQRAAITHTAVQDYRLRGGLGLLDLGFKGLGKSLKGSLYSKRSPATPYVAQYGVKTLKNGKVAPAYGILYGDGRVLDTFDKKAEAGAALKADREGYAQEAARRVRDRPAERLAGMKASERGPQAVETRVYGSPEGRRTPDYNPKTNAGPTAVDDTPGFSTAKPLLVETPEWKGVRTLKLPSKVPPVTPLPQAEQAQRQAQAAQTNAQAKANTQQRVTTDLSQASPLSPKDAPIIPERTITAPSLFSKPLKTISARMRVLDVPVAVDNLLAYLRKEPRLSDLLAAYTRVLTAGLSPSRQALALEYLYEDYQSDSDLLRALTAFVGGKELPLAAHFGKAVELIEEHGHRNTSLQYDLDDVLVGQANDFLDGRAAEALVFGEPGEGWNEQSMNVEAPTEGFYTLFKGQYFTQALADVLSPLLKSTKRTEGELRRLWDQVTEALESVGPIERTLFALIEAANTMVPAQGATLDAATRVVEMKLSDAEAWLNKKPDTVFGELLFQKVKTEDQKLTDSPAYAKQNKHSNLGRFTRALTGMQAWHDRYQVPYGQLYLQYDAKNQQFSITERMTSTNPNAMEVFVDPHTGIATSLLEWVNDYLAKQAKDWKLPGKTGKETEFFRDNVLTLTPIDHITGKLTGEAQKADPLLKTDSQTGFIYVQGKSLTQLGYALAQQQGLMTPENDYQAFMLARAALLDHANLALNTPELMDKNIARSAKVKLTFAQALAQEQGAREGRLPKATDKLLEPNTLGVAPAPSVVEGEVAFKKSLNDMDLVKQEVFDPVYKEVYDTQIAKGKSEALAQKIATGRANEALRKHLEKQKDKERASDAWEYEGQWDLDSGTAPLDVAEKKQLAAAEEDAAKNQRLSKVEERIGETSTKATGNLQNLPVQAGGVFGQEGTEAHGLVKRALDALGFTKTRIHLYTSDQVDAYEAALKERNATVWQGFTTRRERVRQIPAAVAFIQGEIHLYYDKNLTGEALREVLSHELGHVVFRVMLNSERERNTPLWNRLFDEYQEVDTGQRFMEWFADEAGKWINQRDQRVMNATQGFIKRIVDALKAMFRALGLRPAKGAVAAYMDGLALREKEQAYVEFRRALTGRIGQGYDLTTMQMAYHSRASERVHLGAGGGLDFITMDGVKQGTIAQAQRLLEAVPLLNSTWGGMKTVGQWFSDTLSTANNFLREQDLAELTMHADVLDRGARQRVIEFTTNEQIDELLHDPGWSELLGGVAEAKVQELKDRANALRRKDWVAGVVLVKYKDQRTDTLKAEIRPIPQESFNAATQRLYQGQWGSSDEGYRKLLHGKTEAEVSEIGKELLRNDPKSETAKALAAWLKTFYKDYVVEGFKGAHSGTIHIGQQADWGLARYYSPKAVEANLQAFIDLLTTTRKDEQGEVTWRGMQESEAREFASHIITGQEAITEKDLDEAAGLVRPTLSPGAPSKQGRNITLPIEELLPFLETNADAVVARYTHSMIKRVEWEKRFGDEVLMGKNWVWQSDLYGQLTQQALINNHRDTLSASRMKYLLEKTRAINEAYLGRYGAYTTDPRVRSGMSWVQAVTNLLVMPLSLLSQPPDLAGPLIRMSGDLGAYSKGMRDAYRAMRNKNSDLWKVAEMYGIVYRDFRDAQAASFFDSQYLTTGPQKLNDWLFKWNGMQMFTNFSRLLSFHASGYWLEDLVTGQHPDAERWLDDLGLTPSEVQQWVRDGKKEYTSADGEKSVAFKIMLARQRFVQESVFSPNAGQRPLFASHPYAMLVWHLKQFAFSFFTQILKPAYREVKKNPRLYGKMMAVLPLALMMPLALVGMGLRDWLKYNELVPWRGERPSFDQDPEGWLSEMGRIIGRTGVLGPLQLLIDADRQQSWGRSFTFALAGPAASKIEELFLADDGGDFVMKALPGLSLLPAERQAFRSWVE